MSKRKKKKEPCPACDIPKMDPDRAYVVGYIMAKSGVDDSEFMGLPPFCRSHLEMYIAGVLAGRGKE